MTTDDDKKTEPEPTVRVFRLRLPDRPHETAIADTAKALRPTVPDDEEPLPLMIGELGAPGGRTVPVLIDSGLAIHLHRIGSTTDAVDPLPGLVVDVPASCVPTQLVPAESVAIVEPYAAKKAAEAAEAAATTE